MREELRAVVMLVMIRRRRLIGSRLPFALVCLVCVVFDGWRGWAVLLRAQGARAYMLLLFIIFYIIFIYLDLERGAELARVFFIAF